MSVILFVVSNAPYENGLTDESHDLIMASTAYGHNASVLFEGEGVQQLVAEQTPTKGQKNAAKRIQGFVFFDVEPLYVCQSSVNDNNINTDSLIENIHLVSADKKQQLIDNAQFIISL
jgi:sulfur relay protein TusC/DsrF